jgi:hypothetical protein
MGYRFPVEGSVKSVVDFYLDKTGWLIIVFPVKCYEMDTMKVPSP